MYHRRLTEDEIEESYRRYQEWLAKDTEEELDDPPLTLKTKNGLVLNMLQANTFARL